MTICQKWSHLPTLLPTVLTHRKAMWLLPAQMCSQSVGVWPDAPAALESSIQQIIACVEEWRRT